MREWQWWRRQTKSLSLAVVQGVLYRAGNLCAGVLSTEAGSKTKVCIRVFGRPQDINVVTPLAWRQRAGCSEGLFSAVLRCSLGRASGCRGSAVRIGA